MEHYLAIKGMKFCYMIQYGWILKIYAKWNKSDTKGQISLDSSYMRYLELTNVQKQKVNCKLLGASGREEGKLKGFCLGWLKSFGNR